MNYTPVIPFGGLRGWDFLNRTLDRQQALFAGNAPSQRDEAYFREKIGGVKTAEALVADRRLLTVALGAFGLGDDINARAFIRKVLEDGTSETTALGNRLADKRYLALSQAFGLGRDATPRTARAGFADEIIGRYRTESFEAAVGGQNGDMRLALNARGELAEIAGRRQTDDGRWFAVMGSSALRTVFQTAFGLPRQFSSVDLDQQLGVLRDRAERFLGDGEVSQFNDPAQVEKLIRLFLVRSETGAGGGASSGTTALSLLQGIAQRGSLARFG
jgi:hypothetical protein